MLEREESVSGSTSRPWIGLKRIYQPPERADGTRVLVERLWPRGLRKEEAAVDLWLKEVAPSPELRKWYGHRPERWEEFEQRYRAELTGNPEAVERLTALARRQRLTLVFATKDVERSSAAVLRRFLEEKVDAGGDG